jgi:hypothetical protein
MDRGCSPYAAKRETGINMQADPWRNIGIYIWTNGVLVESFRNFVPEIVLRRAGYNNNAM